MKKFDFLYSNFKGKISLKRKEEKVQSTFFNFDIEDEGIIFERVFYDNEDFYNLLKEYNLEYSYSLTIEENLRLLKEKGKIVDYSIFPILKSDEIIVAYEILYNGDYILHTNKKQIKVDKQKVIHYNKV